MWPRSRFVRATDALSLHLLEWSSTGLPLLMLHGFAGHARIWDDAAPHLASRYRVACLDWRGHGDSPWDPERRYTAETYVEDIAAVVDAIGASRVVLVGHSLGGGAAARYASAHPDRMAALILVDQSPNPVAAGLRQLRRNEHSAPPTYASPDDYVARLLRVQPFADPAALDRIGRHDLRRRPDGHFERKLDPAVAGILSSPRPSGKLPLERIRCPTLLVRGASSAILDRSTAEHMVASLEKGRLETVPRAGHAVMADNPEGFRNALASFLLNGG